MECPRCQRKVDSQTRRCTWCRQNVPPGQHLLEESGVVVPFPADDAEGKASATAKLAGLGDRFIATILDTAILFAACSVVDVWAFMNWGLVSGAELRVTAAALLVGGSLNVLIAFLYLWLLEACFGSTLGKAIIGIGVVNDSARNSFAASAIRNLLRIVDGFGFYLVGILVASCSRVRRRVGDFCAGTYVVEGNVSQLTRSLAVVGWLALLTGGAWALPRLCAQPKPLQGPRHLGQVVLGIGRAENSVYMKLPNHRIDLSIMSGSPAEPAAPTADQAASAGSKLGQDSTPAVP
jgi:uncharacterized RDD family membrane protein YckC